MRKENAEKSQKFLEKNDISAIDFCGIQLSALRRAADSQ